MVHEACVPLVKVQLDETRLYSVCVVVLSCMHRKDTGEGAP